LYDNPIQVSPVCACEINVESIENHHSPIIEVISEIADESFVTSIRHMPQTSEGQEKLQTIVLGQKYLKVLSSKRVVNINVLYGVYFSDEGTMLHDKVSPCTKTTI